MADPVTDVELRLERGAPFATSACDFDSALTELGLARRMVAGFDGRVRHSPELRSWLVWDGTRYAEDVTGEVVRQAKATVDQLHEEALTSDRKQEVVRAWLRFQSASHIRAIVDLAETEPGVPVTVGQMDADPWALNVANGVVDLRTGELRPHDPGELHTKLVPIQYDGAAEAPIWGRFLGDVFDDDRTLMDFIKRFAGYSLTGDVREQLLIFAHGSGANGKTTLLGTLRRLAGDYGIQIDPTMLSVGQHEQHPTGLTDLRGARLVTTIETEANRRLAEALVKMLTGGDPIRARRMRADYFEFSPTHHMWLAGNHLPSIRGTDSGIWRRIALVPFDVTFEGDRQDPELSEKLAAEAPGILAWAIEGCLEWQEGGLRVPERVKVATAVYRSSQDHVGRFIADCCLIGDDLYVLARDLRTHYEAWCTGQGERSWSAKALGADLTNRGFESVQRGANRARTWLGFALTADGEPTTRGAAPDGPTNAEVTRRAGEG